MLAIYFVLKEYRIGIYNLFELKKYRDITVLKEYRNIHYCICNTVCSCDRYNLRLRHTSISAVAERTIQGCLRSHVLLDALTASFDDFNSARLALAIHYGTQYQRNSGTGASDRTGASMQQKGFFDPRTVLANA